MMELHHILLLAAGLVIFGLYIYKLITGVDLLQKVALTKPVIASLASAIDAVYSLWPSDALKTVHTVLKAGAESAEIAEQAWLMGELEKESRNEYAKS